VSQIATALYWYQVFRFLISLRGGLVALVYKQTVRTRAVDMGEITGLTLMGTDIDRILVGFRSIHEVWASLLDMGVALLLLERQLGPACLVPGLLVLGES
jgi:ATP-binding cassette, subfamily C (CFTR/MRP), member 1